MYPKLCNRYIYIYKLHLCKLHYDISFHGANRARHKTISSGRGQGCRVIRIHRVTPAQSSLAFLPSTSEQAALYKHFHCSTSVRRDFFTLFVFSFFAVMICLHIWYCICTFFPVCSRCCIMYLVWHAFLYQRTEFRVVKIITALKKTIWLRMKKTTSM
jgi:hypothetical protein